MTKAAEKLNQLLTIGDTSGSQSREDFRVWFLQQFNLGNEQNPCRLEDFAVYFLNSVRLHTEVHLKTNQTDAPKYSTPLRSTKTPAPTNNSANLTPRRVLLTQHGNSLTPGPSSPTISKGRNLSSGSRVVLEESLEDLNISQPQDEKNSFNYSSKTSTPVRRATSFTSSISNHSHSRRSDISSNSGGTTPNHSRHSGTFHATSSICLGDFLTTNTRGNKKATTNTKGKPKKRVVPTTITSPAATCNVPFANNSAFSNENNILKISTTEIDDRNKCSILEARMSLKQNAEEISRELENSLVESKQANLAVAPAFEAQTVDLDHFDHDKLRLAIQNQNTEQRSIVDRIAAIYSMLIDLNFTTNVLNEISFLMNILNVSEAEESVAADDALNTTQHLDQDLAMHTLHRIEDCDKPKDLSLLRTPINCVYFALTVLSSQRDVLAMLDLKSLQVVLCSERLLTLSSDLKLFLEESYQHKQNELQQYKYDEFSTALLDSSCSNVYYQEDRDSRQNFPSNNEFGAFKSQRDLFCNALKYWESHHLNLAWNFKQEIVPKIREIFRLSEHPVNMAHFAQLFVAQLLISANCATSPEEIGVDVDLQKFNKLTQRLLAPSNFSVDYQFPHNQAFFRDFIYEARSIAFLEHLKLAVYSKLMALNNSSLEVVNMLRDEDEDQNESNHNEFIVRPQVLSSLQVLAKFFGFINVLPFNFTNGTPAVEPSSLDKRQIELRGLLQSNFDVERLLREAIKNGKLLITLPWLVQYLAMLDHVTLQLESYVAAMQLLFCLYIQMDVSRLPSNSIAAFIVRCCLGWLFDTKPFITEQYYDFRISYQQRESKDSEWVRELAWFNPSSTPCRPPRTLVLNPMLQSTLPVACPFLAEFRVSIMPAKYAMMKYVSRSGRYRHITTRISEQQSLGGQQPNNKIGSCTLNAQENRNHSEDKLIEAFLHSQNPTTRRLLEFIIERVYKSTIKDAQFSILLPSKSSADEKVNAVTSDQYKEVHQAVQDIYQTARFSAVKQWDINVPSIIEKRINSALDGLLPDSTEPIVKQTYFHLVRRNVASKVSQWRHANLFKTNFYCENSEELAEKVCKMNKKSQLQPASSSQLVIVKHTPCVSDLLDELQYWLHCTSLRPELVTDGIPINRFLRRLPLAFVNVLPTAMYRVVGASTVQLLQNLIARHVALVTTDLLDAFQTLWKTDEMQKYALKTRNNPKEDVVVAVGEKDVNEISSSAVIPSVFGGLITVSFIESLGASKASFDKLKEVLINMVHANLVTVDFINDLFVPILKWEWHPSVLNEISNMLQAIASGTLSVCGREGVDDDSDYDNMKSNLFMETLADLARDADNF